MIALKALWIAALLAVSLVPAESVNPHILIDTGHGGYPLKDGRLSEFRDYAERKGFSVDFKKIGTVDLHEYCLVLSVNPDTVFSQEECGRLRDYLAQGGIFFLTGAGDFENRDHSEVTNPLLETVGSEMRLNDDQLQDTINSGKSYIPLFDQWQPHPFTELLCPISLYSPESVITGGGYPLLQGNATTKSTDTDGSVVIPTQEWVTVLAVERIGKGDLFVGGSWGFVSGLTFQGHREFVDKLLQYVSRKKTTIPFYREAFQGASIVTGEKCRPEVDRKGAEILCNILHGEISSQNTPAAPTVVVGGPEVNPLFGEINPYLPIQFGKDHHWYITRDGHTFYGQEYGIIAVVTVEGYDVLVVAGLGGTGTAGAVNVLEHIEDYALVYTYNEYGEAVLINVSGDVNLNGIQDTSESWEILVL
ncbi:MAG: hypothetical protein HXS48_25105 [Theionarchaea archaeon]|nr:hypothetical protein [Theionarchaea archaeon]